MIGWVASTWMAKAWLASAGTIEVGTLSRASAGIVRTTSASRLPLSPKNFTVTVGGRRVLVEQQHVGVEVQAAALHALGEEPLRRRAS